MTAFEERPRNRIILVPADFTWLDDKTLLVHQGAMLLRPEPDGKSGRVIGYSRLCTDVLVVDWKTKPCEASDVVTCFGCLGATEQ